jgi:hypothetical protein
VRKHVLWDVMKDVRAGREKKDTLRELCNAARVILDLVRMELDYSRKSGNPPVAFLSGPDNGS